MSVMLTVVYALVVVVITGLGVAVYRGGLS